MKYNYVDNDRFEVLSTTGFKDFKKIRSHTTKKVLTFAFENVEDTITVTPNHLFFSDDTNSLTKLATDYYVGDMMIHSKFYYVKIESITETIEDCPVFDLVEVEDHSYITNHFSSHNCSFIGSSKTLIPGENLILLNKSIQEPISNKYGGSLLIYEEPQDGAKYVLGCDPAEGMGKDYSTTQVFKIIEAKDNKEDEHFKLIQVATYRDNIIKPRNYAQVIVAMGKYFNNAWLMIENNSIGHLVCHNVWFDYEYEYMYNPDKGKKGKLGINANKTSKFAANMQLVDLISNFQIKLVDKMTIQELNSYEEISPQRYAAGNSAVHDDTVTSMLWAITFLNCKFYDGYGETMGSDISEEYQLEAAPIFRNPAKQSTPNYGANPFGNVQMPRQQRQWR